MIDQVPPTQLYPASSSASSGLAAFLSISSATESGLSTSSLESTIPVEVTSHTTGVVATGSVPATPPRVTTTAAAGLSSFKNELMREIFLFHSATALH